MSRLRSARLGALPAAAFSVLALGVDCPANGRRRVAARLKFTPQGRLRDRPGRVRRG